MSLSMLDKDQWKSVIKNAVFTFISVFAMTLATTNSLNNQAYFSAASAALMAAFKIVEKLFTPVN